MHSLGAWFLLLSWIVIAVGLDTSSPTVNSVTGPRRSRDPDAGYAKRIVRRFNLGNGPKSISGDIGHVGILGHANELIVCIQRLAKNYEYQIGRSGKDHRDKNKALKNNWGEQAKQVLQAVAPIVRRELGGYFPVMKIRCVYAPQWYPSSRLNSPVPFRYRPRCCMTGLRSRCRCRQPRSRGRQESPTQEPLAPDAAPSPCISFCGSTVRKSRPAASVKRRSRAT